METNNTLQKFRSQLVGQKYILFLKVAWTMKAEMVTEVRNYLPDQPEAPVTR